MVIKGWEATVLKMVGETMPFAIEPNFKLFFGFMTIAGIWSSGSGKSANSFILHPHTAIKLCKEKHRGRNLVKFPM